jgi:hypothetical protein
LAYVPPLTISQRFQANDADWTTIIDNHLEVQETYAPPFVDQYLRFNVTSTTHAERVHFMARGNAALHPIRLRVYARATTGTGTVRLLSDANSNDVTINTAGFSWFTVDVTPTAADSECAISVRVTSGGHSMDIGAVQAYLVPASGADVTGWVGVKSSVWGVADAQVPSRVVEDLLNGVVLVARDRPFCLTSRVSDTLVAVSGKTAEAWGASNSASWQTVGRLAMPMPLAGSQQCTLDAYVTRSGGTATVEIGVGAALRWQFSAAADGWYTTTLRVPESPSQVYASIISGVGNDAAIRSFQIHRGS